MDFKPNSTRPVTSLKSEIYTQLYIYIYIYIYIIFLILVDVKYLTICTFFLIKKCTYLINITRMLWFKDGDRNTAFFHEVVKRRNNSSGIHRLRIDNEVTKDPKIIEDHILDFYKNPYAESISNVLDTDNTKDFIGTYIHAMVSSEENMMLIKCPDFSEIKNVVFNLNGNSAPGPDGFGGVFYHSCWEIIGTNVCNVVQQFFNKTGFSLE